MKKLSCEQQKAIENWLYNNARPLEAAKWDMMFGRTSKDNLVKEMQKYQNTDGGFGNALEADILTPESSATASGEAIFTAQDFALNLTADWAKKLYGYFENTRQDTPSFWECVPKSLEDYPHPPWWGYGEDTKFTPNPCAVIASALILCGTESQKSIGHEIAAKCFDFILNDDRFSDHDTYCLQRLFLSLKQLKSDLITAKSISAMENRISSVVCYDESKWLEYFSQLLDLVDSPSSPWYHVIQDGIEKNAEYWIDNLNAEGVWQPNFSWGVDTEESRTAIRSWTGYIAVRRVKILKAFGFAEDY